ncbi:hypothetical protein GCM10008995_02480 [Halobellus salinus]|uniref:Uncharacterized protein n=1 Tax=Halobellus salinus TaxID=931585 RepID=A0A830EDZ2_9EURY|nr:hypothetical protein [Halobellus salinus]GGI95957.1 hypothetical protein GCM10008995_02480 [Halobellus salinus]
MICEVQHPSVVAFVEIVSKVIVIGNDDPVFGPRNCCESLVSIALVQFVADLDVEAVVSVVSEPVGYLVLDVLIE